MDDNTQTKTHRPTLYSAAIEIAEDLGELGRQGRPIEELRTEITMLEGGGYRVQVHRGWQVGMQTWHGVRYYDHPGDTRTREKRRYDTDTLQHAAYDLIGSEQVDV